METANQPATGRSSWKGALQVSLVTVRVKVYTATAPNAVSFNQLHRGCGCRINYTKSCPEHGPVTSDQITRGYPIDKDRYVVIEDQDLEAVRIESTGAIVVDRFVAQGEIPPSYFEGAHYLEPETKTDRVAYAMLREALGTQVAIAKVCLRGKEDLVAIRVEGLALVMNTLRYHDEIKSPRALDLPPAELVPADHLAAARALVAAATKPFEPAVYQDRYATAVVAMIEAKARGEELQAPAAPAEGKVLDLMAALKASLAAAA